jgi:hypothetical protein
MEELVLEFLEMQKRFKLLLAQRGMEAAVTCGLRTVDQQNALYKIGRTVGGKKVTNARGGESPHNYNLARDYIPVVDGKRTYNPPGNWWGVFGQCARMAGLEWGGDWRTIVDRPHVQHPRWKEAKKG